MPHCTKCGTPVYGGRCNCPAPKDPGPWVILNPPVCPTFNTFNTLYGNPAR